MSSYKDQTAMEAGELREVARDLKTAREALEAVEAQALTGSAQVLAGAVERVVEAVERLEASYPSGWMLHEEAAEYLRTTPDALYRLEGVPRHRLGAKWIYNQRELDLWVLGL